LRANSSRCDGVGQILAGTDPAPYANNIKNKLATQDSDNHDRDGNCMTSG